MSKVSVLMPVFNTKEDYLRESIKSILSQTFTDFEFIIVDDGSTNDVARIINDFNDERIKFYTNEKNLGVSKTRNKLISLAQSEYVAFQDADDVSVPERLEKQVMYLDLHPEISGVSALLNTIPVTEISEQPEFPKILDFLKKCVFTQGVCMLRINDFKKYNLNYNENYITSEDYDLWCRAVLYLKFYNIQEVLLYYRKNPTSLIHTQNENIYLIDQKIKKDLLNNLSCDEKLQQKVIDIVSNLSKKKKTVLEKIFSIRNEWLGLHKYKIITILGLEFKILKKRTENHSMENSL